MIPAERAAGRWFGHAPHTCHQRSPAPVRPPFAGPPSRRVPRGAARPFDGGATARRPDGSLRPVETGTGSDGGLGAHVDGGTGVDGRGRQPGLATGGTTRCRTGLGAARRSVRAGAPRRRPRRPAGYPGAGRRAGAGRLRGSGGGARGGLRRCGRHRRAPAPLHLRAGARGGRRGRRGVGRAGGRSRRAGTLALRRRVSSLGPQTRRRLPGSSDAAATLTAAARALPAAAGARRAAARCHVAHRPGT